MAYVSKAINFVKDYYLVAVDWAEDHPHFMVWGAALGLVSRVFI